MHDLYDDLSELCETLSDELKKTNQKLEKSGGTMTSGDLEYIDKLTHALKSVKTTKAMMESEYSGRSYDDGSYTGMSNEGRRSYRSYDQGRSYARGRNARRDSMGRYSGDEEMISELRELMEDAPNERVKMEFQRFIQKVESM